MFVEGPVDALAVNAMSSDEFPGRLALGLPGASGWRSEWRFLAAGRRCVIGLDADAAGQSALAAIQGDLRKTATALRASRPCQGMKDWAEQVQTRRAQPCR